MRPESALHRFEEFLRLKDLRITAQRQEVLLLAWSTHAHFSAEQMYAWVREKGGKASRATVYRTLGLLVEGGFLSALERGQGQILYEHILGHHHHDHMICLGCKQITEFRNVKIERLQLEECLRHDFQMVNHSLTIEGYCKSCSSDRAASNHNQTGSGLAHD
jgi:Fur family transcriptional regulator, ferric uptake regulator